MRPSVLQETLEVILQRLGEARQLKLDRALVGPRMLAAIEAMEADRTLVCDGTGLRYNAPPPSPDSPDVYRVCFNLGFVPLVVAERLDAAGRVYCKPEMRS